jgi:hypothetical protein
MLLLGPFVRVFLGLESNLSGRQILESGHKPIHLTFSFFQSPKIRAKFNKAFCPPAAELVVQTCKL